MSIGWKATFTAPIVEQSFKITFKMCKDKRRRWRRRRDKWIDRMITKIKQDLREC